MTFVANETRQRMW